MHGSIKSHRTIVPLVGFGVLLSIVAPPPARGSSLLSGYGGPGQGNQAILGSALLNGPRGGSGNGGSAGPPGSAAAGTIEAPDRATTEGVASSRWAAASPTRVAHGRAPTAGSQRKTARGQGSSATAQGTNNATDGLNHGFGEASRRARVGSDTLGLSGEDLLFALLVLGVLAGTAVLTRRLARMTPAGWADS
jgi:hypothetical protein